MPAEPFGLMLVRRVQRMHGLLSVSLSSSSPSETRPTLPHSTRGARLFQDGGVALREYLRTSALLKRLSWVCSRHWLFGKEEPDLGFLFSGPANVWCSNSGNF